MTAQNKDEKMSKTEEKEEETESRTKHRGIPRYEKGPIREYCRKEKLRLLVLETILVLSFFIDRCPINRESEYTKELSSFRFCKIFFVKNMF